MNSPSLIRGWLSESSAHGIIYVAKGRTAVQRTMWLIIFLAACAAFAYNYHKNVMKYLSEPTSIRLETYGSKFVVPDFHFCSIKPLSKMRLVLGENVTSAEVRHLKLLMEKVSNLREEYTSYRNFWPSMPTEMLFKTFGPEAQQTFILVVNDYKSRIPLGNFIVTANMQYFSCFRLQSDPKRILQGMSSSLFYLFTDSYYFDKTSLSFRNNKLTHLNYIYPPMISSPSGIQLFVTAPHAYPHVDSKSVLLGPGKYTVVDVKMQKQVFANTNRAPCQMEREFVHYYNPLLGNNATTLYMKTLPDCKYRRMLENLMRDKEHCQCIPYMVPVTLDMARKFPICGNFSLIVESRQHLNLSFLSKMKRQDSCFEEYFLSETKFDYAEECKFENPCEKLDYSLEVSTSDWPQEDVIDDVLRVEMPKRLWQDVAINQLSHKMPDFSKFVLLDIQNNSKRNNFVKSNIALVRIKVSRPESPLIEESVAYDLEDLIADAGGVAGLWLGMSFLTILEVLNIIHDFIYNNYCYGIKD